jgi:short-subunit dehydrogenase
LYQDIKNRGLRVSGLINNAGFGAYGNFTDLPLDDQVGMVNVNITALMVLSWLFLADMKADDYGRVMNMASLQSYLPFPYYSVYSATKAFVLSCTETLAAEYDGTSVVSSKLILYICRKNGTPQDACFDIGRIS